MDGFENQTTRSTRHSCTATSLPYPGENCVQPALFISPITSWYSHFRLTNFCNFRFLDGPRDYWRGSYDIKHGAQKFIQYRLDMYKFGLILFTIYELTVSYVVTSDLGIFKG